MKTQLKDFLQKPDRVFIVFAALFGIGMLLCMPLFSVPDETVHFYRAYQVGGGHFLSQTVHGITGGEVPQLPLRSVSYSSTIPGSAIKFTAFPTSALYSPVAYIPQSVGIDIGRVLHSSIDSMALMGRFVNLLAYIVLVAIAIKIARQGKWVYAVAGIFPVAIQEAASLSTDVMTIGLAFVTIAFIHNLFQQQTKLTKRQYLLLLLLAAGLGLTKQTNMVLLLPVLFLPRRLFGTARRKVRLVGGAIGVCLLAALAWYAIIKYQHYELNYSASIGLGNVNQTLQLHYVLHHPFSFLKTLIKTYVYEGFRGIPLADFYWTSMYGFFSAFTYKLPIPFISVGYATLLLALLYDGHDKYKESKILTRLSMVQTAVFVLSLVAIAGALYLVWTPVGQYQVAGIQGRYFIPLVPLLIPLFAVLSRRIKVTLDRPYRMGMVAATVAFINLSATLLLTYKFFH